MRRCFDSASQLPIDTPTAGTAESDIDNTATVSRVANTETCDTCSPVSMLKYIDVCITSNDSSVTKYTNALCDSGAEICVIKSSLIKDLPVDVVGKIQLRPFCGQSVNADLVRLTISSVDFDGSNSNSGIDVWCAVAPDLHDDFILTADAVYRLSQSDANVTRVSTRSDSDSNDDTDCNTAAAAVNADNVNVIVTSASDVDNNVHAVESELNHDTLVVGDTDTTRRNDDDDDVITACNYDKSSLGSCSEGAQEQRNDKSLNGCFKLAARDRAGFVVKDGLLYHRAKILGQSFLQSVVPSSRREHVLKMGHEDIWRAHVSQADQSSNSVYILLAHSG